MKVGIITIYDINNYGNRLQNYAVDYMFNKAGITAESLLNIKKTANVKIVFKLLMQRKFNQLCRYLKFKRFDRQNKHEKYIYNKLEMISEQYDFFICGSDQIWNPDFVKDFYFATFASCEKRIAYAASLGVSEIPADKMGMYTEYLTSMKEISVREEIGAQLVNKLARKEALVLLDPTMMLEKSEWEKVEKQPKFISNSPYLLTYFLGNISEDKNVYIENLARKYSLQVVRLEAKNENKEWYATGPAEFLWLIHHCALMCTDSFHGTVFSVLLDVPFIVFTREDSLVNMNSRIDTLLSVLQLEDRTAKRVDQESALKKDYNHIPTILHREREKAIEYLNIALEIDK